MSTPQAQRVEFEDGLKPGKCAGAWTMSAENSLTHHCGGKGKFRDFEVLKLPPSLLPS